MQFDPFSLLIIVVVGGGFLLYFYNTMRVKKYGIEADAVITRVEEEDDTDSDGIPVSRYTFYVRYQTQEGRTVEATLANPKNNLVIGEQVRIKYLPGKEDNPVLI